jgi:hypothetical protein
MVVTNPTDEVLPQTILAESPRVLNFPLLLVVDDDWRELGLGSKLRRQGVSGGGFQKGDVED